MPALKARARKTVADYMRLGEGVNAELIEGEIRMSPAPETRHQRIVVNICFLLESLVRKHRLGMIAVAPVDVILPTGDVFQPDVVFVRREHLNIWQKQIRGIPDLMIEVLSPTSLERDRIVKRRRYARAGVPEYWIVDDAHRSVEVLTIAGASYISAGLFGEKSRFRSAQLRNHPIAVRKFFTE